MCVTSRSCGRSVDLHQGTLNRDAPRVEDYRARAGGNGDLRTYDVDLLVADVDDRRLDAGGGLSLGEEIRVPENSHAGAVTFDAHALGVSHNPNALGIALDENALAGTQDADTLA